MSCLTAVPRLAADAPLQVLPKPAIITAFDLISGIAGLDLNALFEKTRGDVVHRETRFVSMCVRRLGGAWAHAHAPAPPWRFFSVLNIEL